MTRPLNPAARPPRTGRRVLLVVLLAPIWLPALWALLCLVIVSAPITFPTGIAAVAMLAATGTRFGASARRHRGRRVRPVKLPTYRPPKPHAAKSR